MGPTLFFFVLLVLSIIRRLHVVRRRLDEARHRRLQQLAQQLNLGMTPLLQRLQQTSQRQRSQAQWSLERSVPVFASGAWLLAALQHWLSWDVAGVLVLLFGLCWWLSKRSRQPDSLGEDQSGSSHEEQDEEKDEEEVEESAAEDSGDGRHLVQIFAKHMRSSVQKLAYRSRVVEELVGDLLCVFRKLLADTLYLELQPAIGVGSAFEGWSPNEDSAVYRLLVPLEPPRGYTFHLELGRAQEMPAKGSRVRVQLECTCPREQPGEKTLCLLHPAEEELPRDANLLGILCTGFYLDVQKTARWLQDLVRSACAFVPQSRQWDMKVLPSSHSCNLQLTDRSGRSLFVEMILGVQLGNSDIFLSGQTTGAVFTPSTTWTESCAVAEGKFFRHMARQAPRDTFYLQCLQLCTRVLAGTGFSTA